MVAREIDEGSVSNSSWRELLRDVLIDLPPHDGIEAPQQLVELSFVKVRLQRVWALQSQPPWGYGVARRKTSSRRRRCLWPRSLFALELDAVPLCDPAELRLVYLGVLDAYPV